MSIDRTAIVRHGCAALHHLDALAELAPDDALTLWALRTRVAALFRLIDSGRTGGEAE